MRRTKLGLLCALALCGSAGSAFAHAHLKSADPAENATLAAAPTALKLQFSEGLEIKFSGVKVTGPSKDEVELGPAAPGGDTALDVLITGTLAPGKYKVDWHILSKDGHKTKGSYYFTIKP
jgi:copper resistance protein C